MAILAADAQVERAGGAGRALGGAHATVSAKRGGNRRRRVQDHFDAFQGKAVQRGQVQVAQVGGVVGGATIAVAGLTGTFMQGRAVDNDGGCHKLGTGSAEERCAEHTSRMPEGHQARVVRVKPDPLRGDQGAWPVMRLRWVCWSARMRSTRAAVATRSPEKP